MGGAKYLSVGGAIEGRFLGLCGLADLAWRERYYKDGLSLTGVAAGEHHPFGAPPGQYDNRRWRVERSTVGARQTGEPVANDALARVHALSPYWLPLPTERPFAALRRGFQALVGLPEFVERVQAIDEVPIDVEVVGFGAAGGLNILVLGILQRYTGAIQHAFRDKDW